MRPDETRPRVLRWSLLVAPAVAIIAYFWVLHGWFLYDDFTQGYLLDHGAPGIRGNWGPILRDFGRAQFGIEEWVYYRPMMSVWLTAHLELLGVDPVALHAVNLGHHALLSFLVALVCSLYCRPHPDLAAICCGTWFALHPVTIEPIAWFSGNTVTFELLARLGSMTAFVLHLRSGRRRSLVLAIVLACLALVTKESAINLAPALIALQLLWEPSPTLRSLARKQLPFACVWIGYFLLRYVALGTFVAGSHGGATDFFAAVPAQGPLQLRAVFVPFGGTLSGVWPLVAGAGFVFYAIARGFRSRRAAFVLVIGAGWIASQFVPTALNRVFEDLGGSRAHYGTLASVALWLGMLVFGRASTRAAWLGAAMFAVTCVAFGPARSTRRAAFEGAWRENVEIQSRIETLGAAATVERPLAILRTPYDHDGVPQLNRNAHFTLAEVPFVARDLPVLGLTQVFDECGMGPALVGDTSPLRAMREFGATLAFWLEDERRFLLDRRSGPASVPELARDPRVRKRFVFGAKTSPYAIEAVVLRVRGNPTGGSLLWPTGASLAFGSGREAAAETVFRIDVTHDLGLVAAQVAGGIGGFEVRVRGEITDCRVEHRLPRLELAARLRGRVIALGHEAEVLRAPALGDPDLELRLVLLPPTEAIAVDAVEPGQPVEFPSHLTLPDGEKRSLHAELERILRLSRQRRFYYYFEARSPSGRALGGARSPVDWFELRPESDA